jgi:hypothetical protein
MVLEINQPTSAGPYARFRLLAWWRGRPGAPSGNSGYLRSSSSRACLASWCLPSCVFSARFESFEHIIETICAAPGMEEISLVGARVDVRFVKSGPSEEPARPTSLPIAGECEALPQPSLVTCDLSQFLRRAPPTSPAARSRGCAAGKSCHQPAQKTPPQSQSLSSGTCAEALRLRAYAGRLPRRQHFEAMRNR